MSETGMRISDWSSDVCSSDLARPGRCLRVGGGGVAGRVAEGAGAGGAAGLRLARRKEAHKPGWERGKECAAPGPSQLRLASKLASLRISPLKGRERGIISGDKHELVWPQGRVESGAARFVACLWELERASAAVVGSAGTRGLSDR